MSFVRWFTYISFAFIIPVLPVIFFVTLIAAIVIFFVIWIAVIIGGLVFFPIAGILLMIAFVSYIGYLGISYVSSLLNDSMNSPSRNDTSSHAQPNSKESSSSSISNNKRKQKETIPFQSPRSSSSIAPIIAYDQQIDLDNLDLKRTYTLEEFEYINNQLKNRTLEIDGKPINLFELDENGKLTPMPQATYNMELVVTEIAAQLRNWNVYTRQGGGVTTSQGGFKFGTEESEEITTQAGKKIRAPDVAFTPKDTHRNLNEQQLWTFKGEPFTPIFVVEVGDIGTDTTNSAFIKADSRFKDEYFEDGTSVQLGWLIDPKNKRILIYRRGQYRVSLRTWRDISADNTLPGFTLDISLIDDCISQEDSETSSEDESPVPCNECDDTFNSRYEFSKHYEKVHVRKNKRRRIQE